jgi:hypothetical protein
MVVPPVTSGGFFFSVSPSGYRRQLCSIGIARVSRGGSRVDYPLEGLAFIGRAWAVTRFEAIGKRDECG